MRYVFLLLCFLSIQAVAQNLPHVDISGYEATIVYPDGQRFSTSRDEASRTFYEKATELYNQRKFDKALDAINLAMICDNSNSLVLYTRGIIKMKLAMTKDAIPDFDAAIKINNKQEGAYEHRGECKGATGDYAEAAEDFKVAIGQKKTPQLCFELGQTLVTLGKNAEAKKYLKYAVKKGVKDAQKWLDMATAPKSK